MKDDTMKSPFKTGRNEKGNIRDGKKENSRRTVMFCSSHSFDARTGYGREENPSQRQDDSCRSGKTLRRSEAVTFYFRNEDRFFDILPTVY